MTVIKNVEKMESGKHEAPTPLEGRKVEKIARKYFHQPQPVAHISNSCRDPSFIIEKSRCASQARSEPQDARVGGSSIATTDVKEYTLDTYERSTEACYQYDKAGRMEVGANRAVKRSASLLEAIFQHDPSDFYEEYVRSEPTQYDSEMAMGIDGTLLGLIGILSEMKNVGSVPVWLAAGGLTPAVSHTFTKQIASKGWKHIVRLDRGDEDLSARLAPRAHALPKVALPGSEGYLSWFDSPIHLLYWIRRGLTALDRKGIKVEHGM
ncbi:hypothetical protein QFC22_004131 [Naganishia vaughanmartiniae]|uniref:Uncharacterized protein n=1 Tax=Naganishia vaughanmartiniae TaxID=1424756 RepID=A0ACC2X2E8_9TREE|nr:hypothetical protein QFC22_004131 [Naganishia vaughanmartiniae]